jgi:hypothetical protein
VGGALWLFINQMNITAEMRGEENTISEKLAKIEREKRSRESKIIQAIDKATKPWHPETPVPWITRQKYEEAIVRAVLNPPGYRVNILLGPIASGKSSILKHCLKEEPGR